MIAYLDRREALKGRGVSANCALEHAYCNGQAYLDAILGADRLVLILIAVDCDEINEPLQGYLVILVPNETR